VRDQQLKDLIENRVSNFWIFGGRGLGKTLTVNIFKQVMESELSGRDVRVLVHPLTSRSVKDEVRRLCLSLGYRKPANELEADALIKAMKMAGIHSRVCIIFDDVDAMDPVIGTYFSSLLKALYDELLRAGWAFNIHLISIRNLAWAQEKISEAAWSRLQPSPLFFPPYSRDEIVLLLRQRLEFIDGLEWDEAALGTIAEEVAGLGGDFRHALRIAKGVILKHGRLTADIVYEGLIEFRAQVWASIIRALPYECALLLRAIVEEAGRRLEELEKEAKGPEDLDMINPLVSWEDAKARYSKLCWDYAIKRESDAMLRYWLERRLEGDWVESIWLDKHDERNYKRRWGRYLRLKAPLQMLAIAIRQIDWETPW
jgi:Cdc6-like AAA superfamily ATPase